MRAIVCIMLIFLSGCGGFKMRGALDIPPHLRTVYITPYEPYEPLQRALRTQLLEHKVRIVDHPQDNAATLALNRATSSEEVLAVGSSGEVQRYRLTLSTGFSLRAESLQLQRSITRTRELNRSNNMLLSNEGEAQIVRRELLNEAVSEILRQITARPRNKDNNP